MDSRQIGLVRRTHRSFLPRAVRVGIAFYARLFEADPSLRSILQADLAALAQASLGQLRALLEILDQPQLLATACCELGRRQHALGLQEAHYDLFGSILLTSLRETLGTSYTDAVEAAWASAYGELAELMIVAGQSVADTPPATTHCDAA